MVVELDISNVSGGGGCSSCTPAFCSSSTSTPIDICTITTTSTTTTTTSNKPTITSTHSIIEDTKQINNNKIHNNNNNNSKINYNLIFKENLTEQHYQTISNLFSQYGIWKESGRCTQLTPSRLKRLYLFDENCGAVVATCQNGNHLGHALFRRYSVPEHGDCIWISQLLVSREHRQRGIAKSLLKHSLDLLEWKYAGIASANPYAIRSLERATNTKSDPHHNLKHSTIMGHSGIPYITSATPITLTSPDSSSQSSDRNLLHHDGLPYIDTKFHIDIDHVPEILSKEIARGNWHLGNYLPKGFEFLSIILKK